MWKGKIFSKVFVDNSAFWVLDMEPEPRNLNLNRKHGKSQNREP